MEEAPRATRRTDLFLSFDLHTDLQPDGTRYGRLVGSLLEIVPHVHFARERSHLDDCLAEKVVALPRQLLPQLRLEVVVFVPDANLDAVRRVVALAVTPDQRHYEPHFRHKEITFYSVVV